MHYNYKSDEKILKILIHRNILPADPNKKYNLLYIIVNLKPPTYSLKIIHLPRLEFYKKTTLYINSNVFYEIVSLKMTIYVG